METIERKILIKYGQNMGLSHFWHTFHCGFYWHIIGVCGGYQLIQTPDNLVVQGTEEVNLADLAEYYVQFRMRLGAQLDFLQEDFEIDPAKTYYHVSIPLDEHNKDPEKRYLTCWTFNNFTEAMNMLNFIADFFEKLKNYQDEHFAVEPYHMANINCSQLSIRQINVLLCNWGGLVRTFLNVSYIFETKIVELCLDIRMANTGTPRLVRFQLVRFANSTK